MEKLLDLIFLLLFSVLIYLADGSMSAENILVFLIISSAVVFLMSLHQSRKKLMTAGAFVLGALTLIFPPVLFVSPIILFYMLCSCKRAIILLVFGAIRFSSYADMKALIMVIAGFAAAAVVYILTERYEIYKRQFFDARDMLSQENMELSEKNKLLTRKTNDAVSIAVLTERNRIAREIHDNVGHMLTRAILQMGAVEIINTQEKLKEPLSMIRSTLDDAMTNIRQSVHDIHDDSIDLKFASEDCIRTFPENFSVRLDYDITEDIDKDVKLCILGVLKEAVSNIIKHSNGDKVHIIMSEHPGFYKLSVTDNGKGGVIKNSGIGLSNMKSRVKEFNGILEITPAKDSFRVYMTLPKGERYA